jgi:hypothetical protein
LEQLTRISTEFAPLGVAVLRLVEFVCVCVRALRIAMFWPDKQLGSGRFPYKNRFGGAFFAPKAVRL